MSRLSRIAAVLVGSVLVIVPARAEVIHGTATIKCFPWCPFSDFGHAVDFTTGAIIDRDAPGADLSLGMPVNECDRTDLWFSNGALGTFVGGPLENVATAPEPGGTIGMSMPSLNEACVLLTGDGFYVKFAVRAIRVGGDPREADIEYYIQTDGTPEFGPTTPVARKTWGAIKALYR